MTSLPSRVRSLVRRRNHDTLIEEEEGWDQREDHPQPQPAAGTSNPAMTNSGEYTELMGESVPCPSCKGTGRIPRGNISRLNFAVWWFSVGRNAGSSGAIHGRSITAQENVAICDYCHCGEYLLFVFQIYSKKRRRYRSVETNRINSEIIYPFWPQFLFIKRLLLYFWQHYAIICFFLIRK